MQDDIYYPQVPEQWKLQEKEYDYKMANEPS